MVVMDKELDLKPAPQLIINFVRTAIRNKQCFRELEYLNRKGILLMKHPLLQNFSMQQQLKHLLRSNPDKFLSEYTLAKNNISRYQSYLNNEKKGTGLQRNGWQACLLEHVDKVNLMANILKEIQQ
jgi:hypothetical protein